ncbi:MAG: ABC transporter ATP-binding protein [Pseudomonadales bacterium]
MLALHDIPLGGRPFRHEFASGSIAVVLGRNRSGKTELCRLIAGLATPASGSIVLDGVDVTRTPPGQRSVALVYQAFVNYPNLSVFENIASPLRARRLAEAAIRERVERIAVQLQLAPLLERRPDQLSGGQQQRLAVGRALAKGARVLVLDEPLVNLDYKLREALELELRGMLHAESLVVIYTTSDPRDAFNLGDEVLLLDDHRLLQCGRPVEVYERPCSPAAADLMSDPGINRFRDGECTGIVRPEHLGLQAPAAAGREFAMVVLSVETNGSETYLHGTVGDDHWVAKLKGLHRVAAGARITLHATAQSVLRFEDSRDG